MVNASPAATTTPSTHAAVAAAKPDPTSIVSIGKDIENLNPIAALITSGGSSVGTSIGASVASALNPIDWLTSAFGDNIQDLLERAALMLFGAVLVVVGLIMFVQSNKTVQGAEKDAAAAAVLA